MTSRSGDIRVCSTEPVLPEFSDPGNAADAQAHLKAYQIFQYCVLDFGPSKQIRGDEGYGWKVLHGVTLS